MRSSSVAAPRGAVAARAVPSAASRAPARGASSCVARAAVAPPRQAPSEAGASAPSASAAVRPALRYSVCRGASSADAPRAQLGKEAAKGAQARVGAGAGAVGGSAGSPAGVPSGGSVRAASLSSSSPSSREPSLGRVAYQGFPGAYSEMACLKGTPGYEPMPCEQFETAFQAISQWVADRAVLPVENSLGGSIHAVYDLLLRYDLHIVGEVLVPIDHCLLALPGVKKEDLKRVLSHPQALAQTDGYLRRLGVVREAADDTAGSARLVAERGWRDAGAVASARAAELYGLEVLDRSIQDDPDNVTRFIVLSRDPVVADLQVPARGPKSPRGRLVGGGLHGALCGGGAVAAGGALFAAEQANAEAGVVAAAAVAVAEGSSRDGAGEAGAEAAGPSGGAFSPGLEPPTYKTSIVFTLNQGPGMLFRALSVFALRDINLTKIESRPVREDPLVNLSGERFRGAGPADADARRGEQTFNYLFYIDFLGSLAEEHIQNALRHLHEFAPFLRILGSYPRATMH